MWKKAETEEPQYQPQYEPVAPAPISPAPKPVKEPATIGKTIHIKGDLMGEEDLLIEGYIDGKIQLRQHNVTVGKNGHVNADIYGNTISIEGDVEGNLFGKDKLILGKSSKVRGNITAPRVVLEDGCNFKGNIDMSRKKEDEKPSPSLLSESQFDGEAVDTGSMAPSMNAVEI
jgi:cytoskeletal protein CcmA (bactofilin family)